MELNQISESNYIDTTNEESIQKYKKNLIALISETQQNGINRFVTIRNDDFFPESFEWLANCKHTYGDYFTIAEYKTIASKETAATKNGIKGFLSKLIGQDKMANSIYTLEKLKMFLPVSFISTKHFTVNTALGLTGEYNGVPSNRVFTFIDDLEVFLTSGYGYSLSEKDAYCDVTHEPLKISPNAVVMVSVEDYKKLKNNTKIMNLLSKRKLIIFKGDRIRAINMFLTESGILPFRIEPEYDYLYSQELKEQIAAALQEKCQKYGLYYNHNHGGTQDSSHFTSLISDGDNGGKEVVSEFIRLINQSLTESRTDIDELIPDQAELYSSLYSNRIQNNWDDIIAKIGIEKFKQLLNQFNKEQEEKTLQKREKYIEERKRITSSEQELFRSTVQLLNANKGLINMVNYDDELTKMIRKFYISFYISEQREAAIRIQSLIEDYTAKKQKAATVDDAADTQIRI